MITSSFADRYLVLPFWTTTAGAGADATAYLNSGALLSSTCNFRNASLQRSEISTLDFGSNNFAWEADAPRIRGRSPESRHRPRYCGDSRDSAGSTGSVAAVASGGWLVEREARHITA